MFNRLDFGNHKDYYIFPLGMRMQKKNSLIQTEILQQQKENNG